MKKLLLILMVALFSNSAMFSQNLIITEVVDGPGAGGYPKYVEVTNIGDAAADMTGYIIKRSSNGDGFTDATFTFETFSLPASESVVVTNMDNATEGQLWTDFSLVEPTYFITNGGIVGNGDDAYGLFNASDVLVDIFGIEDEDGTGMAWEYLDSYAKRKITVTSPTATFDIAEWDIAAPNTLDGLTDLSSYLSPGQFLNVEASDKTDIIEFSVPNQEGSSIIDATAHTVKFKMVEGTNVTALVPTIVVSTGATISPASEIAQDFSSTVTYTVTAEDESTTQTWDVSVEFVAESNVVFEDDFNDGTLDKWNAINVVGDQIWEVVDNYGVDGSQCAKMSGYAGSSNENEDWLITPLIDIVNNGTVKLTFATACNYSGDDIKVKFSTDYSGSGAPSGGTWTDIADVVLSAGDWNWTESGDIILSDLSSSNIYVAFVYTSTATESKTWELDNVSIEASDNVPSTETDILTFVLAEESIAAVIDAANHTVTAEVVAGTDLTALKPTITLSDGATISPASGVATDFTSAVKYTVTAEDETTTQEWTVTVTEAENLSSDAEILTFKFDEEVEPAVIDSIGATISSVVAWNTDVTSLTPTFTISAGAQVSETVDVDFTNPYTIKVQAQDKVTFKDWVVTVTLANAPSKLAEITAFELDELVEPVVIDSANALITGKLVSGTVATALKPDVTVSAGATISPESAQDFTDSVVYTVIAEDTSITKIWTVKLTVEPTPLVSIYDIQYTTAESGESPMLGEAVVVKGTITGFDSYGFFMQDSAKAWNGIYVFAKDYMDGFSTKDIVKVEGKVNEYYGLTQIADVVSLKRVGDPVGMPDALDLNIADIDESYESLFAKVTELTCSDTELYYDAWKVTKDGNDLYVGNDIYTYTPEVGEDFESITGIVTFKRDYFRLLPRKAADIVSKSVYAAEDAFAGIKIYPNPFSNNLVIENIEDINTVCVYNLTGETVEHINANANTIQVNTAEYANGIYFVHIKHNSGQTKVFKIVK